MTDGDSEDPLKLELSRALRDARVLRELATGINAAADLSALYALVTRAVDELFGFQHAMVLLLSAETGLLEVAASRGYEDVGIGATVKLGVGVIGMAAKKRRVMRVTGMRMRGRYAAAVRGRMQEAGTQVADEVKLPGLVDVDSQIAIPMLIGDRLIGVLAVESVVHQGYSESDEILVSTIANHFGAAIENARNVSTLEDRVRRRTRDLEATNVALREAQAQLVQSEKMAALGKLVAGVAHDMNTPLGAIRSTQQTMTKAATKLHDALAADYPEALKARRVAGSLRAMQDAAHTVGQGTNRIGDVVDRLRSFARLDEALLQEVDLRTCVEDVLALLTHRIPDTVSVTFEMGDVPKLRCHPSEVNQLMMNVVVNALDAIGVSGAVLIRASADDTHAVLVVQDDGEGIDEANLPRIFDPGFTTRGVGVGAGLGLSIAYRVAEQHGGSIEVTSKRESGTCVTMRLSLSGPGQ